MNSNRQSGQIGVVIVLIMTVMMTVGLSLAANTNKDLINSQQSEESNRVFNAAEAGIEEALTTDFPEGELSGSLDFENANVNYLVSKKNILNTILFEGVSAHINVAGTGASGVQITWSREDDCASSEPASLLVGIFYDDGGTLRVRYETLGACDSATYNRDEGFTQASHVNENNLHRQAVIALTGDDQFMRIKPLYNDTEIEVRGTGGDLPVQGEDIRSEAQNKTGDETRIVQVNRSLPAAPSIMDYAVYSGTTINK